MAIEEHTSNSISTDVEKNLSTAHQQLRRQLGHAHKTTYQAVGSDLWRAIIVNEGGFFKTTQDLGGAINTFERRVAEAESIKHAANVFTSDFNAFLDLYQEYTRLYGELIDAAEQLEMVRDDLAWTGSWFVLSRLRLNRRIGLLYSGIDAVIAASEPYHIKANIIEKRCA